MELELTRGEKLRIVMERRGISPYDLADRIGTSYMTLYRLLHDRGRAELRIGAAMKLSRELDVPLGWIADSDPDSPSE